MKRNTQIGVIGALLVCVVGLGIAVVAQIDSDGGPSDREVDTSTDGVFGDTSDRDADSSSDADREESSDPEADTSSGGAVVDTPSGDSGGGSGLTDEQIAAAQACDAGNMYQCDQLYRMSPEGSEAEAFGATCGDRWSTYDYADQCATLEMGVTPLGDMGDVVYP